MSKKHQITLSEKITELLETLVETKGFNKSVIIGMAIEKYFKEEMRGE